MEGAERQRSAASHRGALPSLLATLDGLRDEENALAHAKPRGGDQVALNAARHATLAALLEYAAAIEALAWPVPRTILTEIKMHRILCDPRRHATDR